MSDLEIIIPIAIVGVLALSMSGGGSGGGGGGGKSTSYERDIDDSESVGSDIKDWERSPYQRSKRSTTAVEAYMLEANTWGAASEPDTKMLELAKARMTEITKMHRDIKEQNNELLSGKKFEKPQKKYDLLEEKIKYYKSQTRDNEDCSIVQWYAREANAMVEKLTEANKSPIAFGKIMVDAKLAKVKIENLSKFLNLSRQFL